MSLPATVPTAFTITLHSVTNNSASSSDAVDNTTNGYAAAKISLKITTGSTAHTDGSVFNVYLLFSDNHGTPIRDDNWTGSASTSFFAFNSRLLGTLKVSTATNTAHTAFFNTKDVVDHLGPVWGIAVENKTGQTTNSTAGNHAARFLYVLEDSPV